MNSLRLWNNPIIIRYCRSELRLKKSVFWYLLTFIVTAFTVAVIYVPLLAREQDITLAARSALFPLLIIQGILLLFMGTGSVAGGITREKVDEVLDYQRLTPLPVRDKIIGYLFGLPIREYVLFAITLPFLAFIVITGKLPLPAIAAYYLVFFSSTLLYHLTGMVAGMIARKWRFAARLSQGFIFLLYFFLPQLSRIGLVFLEFLTVRPTFREHIFPLISGSMEAAGAEIEVQTGFSALLVGKSVPFFTFTLSSTAFSFVLQALIGILFALIIARKWHGASTPSFSKPMALTTFATFGLLSLGNIWPNLSRSENALPILQSNNPEFIAASIAVLPLVIAFSTALLGVVLLLSAVPDPLGYRQGLLRAARQNRDALPAWADASGGYPLVASFVAMQALLLVVILVTLHASDSFSGLSTSPASGIYLLIACSLFLLYFQGLKENFGRSQIGIFILLHWLVPLLAAILVLAANQAAFGHAAIFISALSPLALLILAAFPLSPLDMMGEFGVTLQRALGLGIVTLVACNGFLHWRLLKFRRAAAQSRMIR